ncbi:uncharacterized protein LOC129739655 isoform X1 [Uranotaenia lowii]|uniref:uncharacterized protein LOC129739655 isoform X1 n=1 Tax=Uranotaenia lowii TaxID=190385 RepID=UPI002479A21F|nr:uncharacterized protein LOC129739655 isoform X1 [Uranotaenia lowii]
MAQRNGGIVVDEVLPNDDNLGARSGIWKSFLDKLTGRPKRRQLGSQRPATELTVFQTARHCRTVIEQQLQRCIHRLLATVSGWFVLRARKRTLQDTMTNPLPSKAVPVEGGPPSKKYASTIDREEFTFDDLKNHISDSDVDDGSPAEDVESESGAESDQENRDEIDRQLAVVVENRKRTWQQSGLQKMMESIEDQSGFNELSHEKVENWLFHRTTGAVAYGITKGQETKISETNETGDSMKYHRKQKLTVSSKEDEDSLCSVDEKKYILSNTKNKNIRKVKVVTTIKQYTIATNQRPGLKRLHSINNFPVIAEEPASPVPRPMIKSDSVFETGAVSLPIQMIPADNPGEKRNQLKPLANNIEKPSNARRKVFKKTQKKGNSTCKKGINTNALDEFEKAIETDRVRVKKVTLSKAKHKTGLWKEESMRASTSSEDDLPEVFPESNVPPAGSPTKKETRRVLRRGKKKSVNRIGDSSDASSIHCSDVSSKLCSDVSSKHSPEKKSSIKSSELSALSEGVLAGTRPTCNVLISPFKAISLRSPRKLLPQKTSQPVVNDTQVINQPTESCSSQIDQTTNMSSLFSANNDRIVNSTQFNNTSALSTSKLIPRGLYTRTTSLPDHSRCVTVYEPEQIVPSLPRTARTHITLKDLNLSRVTKKRHLDRFQTFSFTIHPNSSVRFYPSDSDEDDRSVASFKSGPSTKPPSSNDESFDDDDPIMTYKHRYAPPVDLLKVLEIPFKRK